MPESALYDQDCYAWANEQAALLRAGNLAAADIENIAEEMPVADKAITAAYLDARLEVSAETKLSRKSFPATCPWTLAQIADENFWPA